mgnify:CR=1 FL=1
MARLDHDPPPPQGLGKGARAVANQLRFFLGLRQVHGQRQLFLLSKVRHAPVQSLTHAVGRVRRYAHRPHRGREAAQPQHLALEILHGGRHLRRTRPEHFLVDDAAPAEPHQRLHRRTCTPGFGNARDAAGPALAQPGLGGRDERVGRCGVLKLAEVLDPLNEVGLAVLTRQVGELEVRVRVDEPRGENRVPELQLLRVARRRDLAVRTHRCDAPVRPDEDGAVLDRRRRDRIHHASPDTEHRARA